MKVTLVWAGVALVAIVGALGVGLSFAGWKDQSIIGWMTAIGVFAATVFGLMAKIEGRNEDQSETLKSIEAKADTAAVKAGEIAQRVNGELDQRIANAMEEAAEMGAGRVLAVLREQGVLR